MSWVTIGAVNAMQAAGSPRHFLGIDPNGLACSVSTKENPSGHIWPPSNENPIFVNFLPHLTLDLFLKFL